MKISEVSKHFSVSIQTLRYYERIGVIPNIPRDTNGFRDYRKSDLYWIHYVQALRRSGVSIHSIQTYVGLVRQGATTRDERKAILLEQRRKLLEQRALIDDALIHMDQKLSVYDEYVVALEENTRPSDQ
ncbi:MerR family transcriptional regulator [Levilactobacillus brevis]|uniref:MerR family transcriptional regulator n=1 Tax=Levilactobacillus brevis TaxID=1580 RepID=UPI003D16A873